MGIALIALVTAMATGRPDVCAAAHAPDHDAPTHDTPETQDDAIKPTSAPGVDQALGTRRHQLVQISDAVLKHGRAVDDLPNETLGIDAIEFDLTVDGRLRRARLWPHSVRGPGFTVTVVGPNGAESTFAPPPPRTWRGRILDDPDSRLAGTLTERGLQAILEVDGERWGLDPLPAIADAEPPVGAHALYRTADLLADEGTCGVDQLALLQAPPPLAPLNEGGIAGGACSSWAEIAFDADFEFFEANSNSVAQTIDDIESITNGVSALYESQFGLSFGITQVIVRSTLDDPYTATAAGSLLQQFRTDWNANQSGVPRDVAHLMTGRNLDGSTIGIAYGGVVCSAPSLSYALSQSKFSSQFVKRVGLTAHELGHNFDASHCNGDSDCSVMCSSLGGCTGNLGSFGGSAANEILGHLAAVSCLAPPASLPPPSIVAASDGACGGIDVNWSPVAGAASYLLYRSLGVADPQNATLVTETSSTGFFDSSPIPNLNYAYWVRTNDGCNLSTISAADFGVAAVPPVAPDIVVATQGTLCSAVTITWSPVPGAATYQIWRGPTANPGLATLIATDSSSPYTDSSVSGGGAFYYWVRSVSTCGQVSGFEDVAVGAAAPLPPPPDAVAASDALICGAVLVTWAPLDEAESYQVWRSDTPSLAGAELIGSSSDLVFFDVGAPPGETQYYSVASVSACGAGHPGDRDPGSSLSPVPALESIDDRSVSCSDVYEESPPALIGAACIGGVTWSLPEAPPGMTVSESGVITWTAPTVGTHPVTLQASNAFGADEVSWQLSVTEAAPLIAAIDDPVIGCNGPFPGLQLAVQPSGCAATPTWELENGPAGLLVSAAGAVTWDDATPGVHPVTVRATTEFGVDTASFTISIVELLPPIIVHPGDASTECGVPYIGPTPALLDPDCMGAPVWTLVDAPPGMVITPGGAVSWSAPLTGTHPITIAVSTPSGVDVVDATLEVIDSAPPVVEALQTEVVIAVGPECTATVPDLTGAVSASDACSGVASLVQTPAAGTTVPIGVTPVIVTAVDAGGRSASSTILVRVEDQTPPVIVACPPTVTVADAGGCSGTIPDLVAELTVIDACSDDLLVLQVPPPGSDLIPGVNTVTFLAFDGSGNVAACSTSVSLACSDSLYVDDGAVADGDGLSWATALNDLDLALELAAASDVITTVRVAGGIYRPRRLPLHDGADDPRHATFRIPSGVTVRGGYAGADAAEPGRHAPELHPTVLSGDLRGDDDDLIGASTRENVFHVVTVIDVPADAPARLDSVVVRGGRADGPVARDGIGGGVLIERGDAVLRDVTLRGNSARRGGGLGVVDAGPTLVGCRFERNQAHLGSAVLIQGATRSETTQMIGCTLLDHRAVTVDERLALRAGDADHDVTDLVGDRVDREWDGERDGEWDGDGNAAPSGAAIHVSGSGLQLESSLVARAVGASVGAIDVRDGALRLDHVTIADCSARRADGVGGVAVDRGSTLELRSSILWGNDAADRIDAAAQLRADGAVQRAATTVQLGALDPALDESLDPAFTDAVAGDYTLRPGSPAIDAGLAPGPDRADVDRDGDRLEPHPVDARGATRLAGAATDRGAFECQDRCGAPGDLDGDGRVTATDLRALLAAWGPVSGPDSGSDGADADLTGDGRVDDADLDALLEHWTG